MRARYACTHTNKRHIFALGGEFSRRMFINNAKFAQRAFVAATIKQYFALELGGATYVVSKRNTRCEIVYRKYYVC